ncbi:hypothetical protein J7411_18405 [Xanthomonas phaseoli pv. dieffenbachiae]|nr:hypothetical protein [Xanthomonas phaseoli pv. dieffenbachiae]
MDEIRAEYISSMGEELGASFYELYRKLVELHILWQQYRQLFGNDTGTVHLLKEGLINSPQMRDTIALCRGFIHAADVR